MFKTFYLFISRQRGDRGEGTEKERGRNINMWLPPTHPPLETWLATQVHALTGNGTGDPLVHRSVLNPLSYTSQGKDLFLSKKLQPKNLTPTKVIVGSSCIPF